MNPGAPEIRLVPYTDQYRDAFRSLNESWIRQWFQMEEKDIESLHHPRRTILDKGGHIVVALSGVKAVGVCALMKMDHPEFDYELAKMGVDTSYRGRGIGFKLGQAVLQKAKELGARNVYLESNTVLEPAISLYRKLGFQKIESTPSPYARCNIQMLISLQDG